MAILRLDTRKASASPQDDSIERSGAEGVKSAPAAGSDAGSDRPVRQHTLAEAADAGRREAVNSRPASDALVPSAVEQSYIDQVRSHIRRMGLEITSLIGVCLRTVAANRLQTLDTELFATHAAGRVAEVKVKHAEGMVAARLVERKAKLDKRKFKDENKLTREAVYAPSMLYALGILALFVLVETVINAGIFMNSGDMGLIGGGLIATICSAINVGLGFGAGVFGLRLIGHVNPRLVKWGWIVLGVCVAVGVAFNLLVAICRSWLEAQTGVDAGLAGVLLSIVLALVGFAIFFMAMIKGRGGRGCLFDPYLGYRPLDATDKEAEATYEGLKQDYRDEVGRVYDDIEASLVAIEAENGRRLMAQKDAEGEVEQKIFAIRAVAQNAVEDGLELIRTYRAANIRVRDDAAPAYFTEEPRFEVPGFDMPGVARLSELVADSAAVQQANQPLITQLRRRLAERRVEDVEGFLELIDRIEKRADDRLIQDALGGLASLKTGEA